MKTLITATVKAGYRNVETTKAAAALCSGGKGLGELPGSAPLELEFKLEPPDPIFWQGPIKPIFREAPKQNRNSRCLCGSGRKYKRCCGQNA